MRRTWFRELLHKSGAEKRPGRRELTDKTNILERYNVRGYGGASQCRTRTPRDLDKSWLKLARVALNIYTLIKYVSHTVIINCPNIICDSDKRNTAKYNRTERPNENDRKRF